MVVAAAAADPTNANVVDQQRQGLCSAELKAEVQPQVAPQSGDTADEIVVPKREVENGRSGPSQAQSEGSSSSSRRTSRLKPKLEKEEDEESPEPIESDVKIIPKPALWGLMRPPSAPSSTASRPRVRREDSQSSTTSQRSVKNEFTASRRDAVRRSTVSRSGSPAVLPRSTPRTEPEARTELQRQSSAMPTSQAQVPSIIERIPAPLFPAPSAPTPRLYPPATPTLGSHSAVLPPRSPQSAHATLATAAAVSEGTGTGHLILNDSAAVLASPLTSNDIARAQAHGVVDPIPDVDVDVRMDTDAALDALAESFAFDAEDDGQVDGKAGGQIGGVGGVGLLSAPAIAPSRTSAESGAVVEASGGDGRTHQAQAQTQAREEVEAEEAGMQSVSDRSGAGAIGGLGASVQQPEDPMTAAKQPTIIKESTTTIDDVDRGNDVDVDMNVEVANNNTGRDQDIDRSATIAPLTTAVAFGAQAEAGIPSWAGKHDRRLPTTDSHATTSNTAAVSASSAAASTQEFAEQTNAADSGEDAEDVEKAVTEAAGPVQRIPTTRTPTSAAAATAAAATPSGSSNLARLPRIFQDAFASLQPLLSAQMQDERSEGWNMDDLYAAEETQKREEEAPLKVGLRQPAGEALPPERKVVRKTMRKILYGTM